MQAKVTGSPLPKFQADSVPKRRRVAPDIMSRLDALRAPSLLELRMNPQNLIREMAKRRPHSAKGPDAQRLSVTQAHQENTPSSGDCRGSMSGSDHAMGIQKLAFLAKKRGTGTVQSLEEQWAKVRNDHEGQASHRSNKSRHSHAEQWSSRSGKAGKQHPDQEPGESARHAKAGEQKAPREDTEVVREDRWVSIFQNLQDDGEIHRDSMASALSLAGFIAPDEDMIREVLNEITQFTTLDLTEFTRFMVSYSARQFQSISTLFKQFDKDGSGTIEFPELRLLLDTCGIIALDQVVREVIEEVSPYCQEQLNLDEFREVLDIIRTREGFSRSDAEKLKQVFLKFDLDRQGTLDNNELQRAFGWLGLAHEPEEIQNILQEVDLGGKGELHMHEFLVCIRKAREREILTLKKALEDCSVEDFLPNGLMQTLDRLLRQLGYPIPDLRAIADAAQDAGLTARDLTKRRKSSARRGSMHVRLSSSLHNRRSSALLLPGLRRSLDAPTVELPGLVRSSFQPAAPLKATVSEVYRFLEIFRQREGLTRDQADELDEAFLRYDQERAGEISITDVGKVLRWFGFPASFDLQRHLILEVDIDKSGRLDEVELKKLIRKFKEREVQRQQTAFEEFCDQRSVVSEKDCMKILRRLGFQASSEEVKAGVRRQQQRDLGLSGSASASSATISSEESSSSSESEAESGSDSDGSQTEKERKSMESETKSQSSEEGLATAPRRTSVVREAGFIDLETFLEICLMLNNRAREDFRNNAGLTSEELEEMKRKFKKYDEDNSGSISNKELRKLLEDLYPDLSKDPKLRPSLIKLLEEVEVHAEGDLDFGDFIRLMRQFHDLRHKGLIAQEQRIVEMTGFGEEEVDEFRLLFMGKHVNEGISREEMTFLEFTKLIGSVVTMNERNTQELLQLFGEVLDTCGTEYEESVPVSTTTTMIFPEFLLLMKKILEVDWGSIQDKSKAIASAATRRTQRTTSRGRFW